MVRAKEVLVRKQNTLAAIGIALAMVAGFGYHSSQAVAAFAICYYEGEAYSTGACIDSACEKPEVQYCTSSGTWRGCGGCPV